MASIEVRGSSVRVTWPLGGRRGGAKQSCTFTGSTETGRMKWALAAKALVESRGHDITRTACYEVVLGAVDKRSDTVPTFKQWAQQWIAARREARDAQSDVLDRYERCLMVRTVPYLGHKKLTEIDRESIKGWVRWMSSSHVTYGSKNRRVGDRLLAAQTIGKHFMVTSACLAAAVPKWITVNPAAPLPGERKNGVGLPAATHLEGMFLDAQEIGLILRQCHPHLYDLVYVALRTGMRMGELIALEAQYVVFPRAGGATVLVRKALKSDGTVGGPKSAASRRDLPVSGKAAEILGRRVQGRRPSDLVFTSPRGAFWNTQSLRDKHWYRAVAAARRCPEHPPPPPEKPRGGPTRGWRNHEISTCGCPGLLLRRPRFHDLRHTHASALIADGWHAKKVQRRMGHSRFQTTMDVYGHLMDLGGEGELDGIEEFLEPARATPRRRAGSVVRRVRRVAVRHLPSRRSAVS